MTKHWFKNAIIYSLDIEVFADDNNDGIGDIRGAINKLDYLRSIGISCIWLLPVYPSPKVDDGYDVKDYKNIDPDIGDLQDFDEFVYQARLRGMRIIMDLVVNHTSIEHPWFLEAKSSRDNPYRDYYVWHDNPDDESEKVIFSDTETSIWEHSPETDSYYLHRFYKEQADLNIANSAVRQEILDIMKFWVDRGVSGFRVDAAHIITDPTHIKETDYTNLHQFFEDMRALLEEIDPDLILLGEASVPPKELEKYFKSENGNPRMHMLFNFLSNKHLFLAMAREDGASLVKGLDLVDEFQYGHWLNFVRHHDELNLELLDDKERREVWNAFAPEEDMRIFGHGIRRRLPPMVKNDRRRMKLFYAITFSLPGTAMINYGEEIGMGDDLSLSGRDSVRTPMQWSTEPNGGFSTAAKEELYRPVIDHGQYHYKNVNLRQEQMDPDSFFNWMCLLIRMRTQFSIIGNGKWKILKTPDRRVAAFCYRAENSQLLVVFNCSREDVTVKIAADFKPIRLSDVFADYPYDEADSNLDQLKLRPYGFRWIEIYDKEELDDSNPSS